MLIKFVYFKFFNYLVYSQLVGAYHSAGYAFSLMSLFYCLIKPIEQANTLKL